MSTPIARGLDRGSLAVEYVIVAPLFLIVFGLIFAYARVSELDGLLDSGTRAAARAVTLAPDLTQADAVALSTVREELGVGSGGCSKDNVTVTVVGVDPSNGARSPQLAPGDTVIVTARCQYSLTDLGLPFPTPEMTEESQFASQIDPNRSTT